MNSAMRTTILWLHAVGGVAWVGAATVFVIAAIVVGREDEGLAEGPALVRRVAPVINRIGLAAMLFIVASGIVNIYIAGVMRDFAFSNSFIGVLAVKIALLSAMYVLLTMSWRCERQLASTDPSEAHRAVRRLIIFNAAIVGLGAAALLMGLWLLGT
jgi:putative copper export protein